MSSINYNACVITLAIIQDNIVPVGTRVPLHYWLIFIAAAYLVGSIPFGVMLARSQGINIREHGSRNVGATNVWRVLGKRFGLPCFILDVLKGALPVIVAGVVCDVIGHHAGELSQLEMSMWIAVAAAAILGHMFSIFLRFGGGKGVATALGAMLGMWPLFTIAAVMAVMIWYVTLRLTKYVGLASVIAALSLPVLAVILNISNTGEFDRVIHAWPLIASTAVIALIVTWKHRGNLARIRMGEEPRVRGK